MLGLHLQEAESFFFLLLFPPICDLSALPTQVSYYNKTFGAGEVKKTK